MCAECRGSSLDSTREEQRTCTTGRGCDGGSPRRGRHYWGVIPLRPSSGSRNVETMVNRQTGTRSTTGGTGQSGRHFWEDTDCLILSCTCPHMKTPIKGVHSTRSGLGPLFPDHNFRYTGTSPTLSRGSFTPLVDPSAGRLWDELNRHRDSPGTSWE